MSKSVEIELTAAKEWNKKAVKSVVVKEPSGRDYGQLGEPRLLIRNPDGAAYHVEQPSVVWGYVERCVDHEGGRDFVQTLDLADVMKIKRTIFDFFTQAAAVAYAT